MDRFRVEFLEEAKSFLDGLSEKERDKIVYNIWKAKMSNNNELFKKLQDEIWEFRTLYNKFYFRLFAFWDKSDKADTIVIATHGITKTTAKTPKTEIERANKIREKYFNQKNQSK